MVSVLASSAVDRWGLIKDYNISICCVRTKHTALRSKRKDCLTLNRGKVSRVEQYVYMRTIVSVNQHYEPPAEHVGLVQSGHNYHSPKCNFFWP